MAEDFLSFEEVLKELQMQEGELRGMVSQGKLRAFRDENTLKFRRADVEKLREERSTVPTDMGVPAQPQPTPTEPPVQQVAEEPIDLLADDILDYDDAAETIIGDQLAPDTSETEFAMADTNVEPLPASDSSTGVPTIELTPTDAGADETTVPTLELSEDAGLEPDTGSDTEIPTMVLGLDEYDDTQVATEEVATEEVYIDESDLAESGAPTAELDVEPEEPYVAPEEAAEAEEAVGSISASSGFRASSAEALLRREAPSALFTITSVIAVVFLAFAGIFFYCMISQQVPKWGILESIMNTVWDQFNLDVPRGLG